MGINERVFIKFGSLNSGVELLEIYLATKQRRIHLEEELEIIKSSLHAAAAYVTVPSTKLSFPTTGKRRQMCEKRGKERSYGSEKKRKPKQTN
jgi:hypothetical protein